METGVKLKYWEIFNRIFLTIWILTRFYNNFFDSLILCICGVLTADYFYNSKKSGDHDKGQIEGLLSPIWVSPHHSKLIGFFRFFIANYSAVLKCTDNLWQYRLWSFKLGSKKVQKNCSELGLKLFQRIIGYLLKWDVDKLTKFGPIFDT